MESYRSTGTITDDVVESQVIQRSCEPTLPSEEKLNWSDISSYLLDAEDGSQVPFGDIFTDSRAIVIFIRHLLCFVTKEYVEDLGKLPRDLLRAHKVRLVVIGCSPPKFLRQFRHDTRYSAELYTDPERCLYKMMGCIENADLGRVSRSKHVKSSVLTGVLKSTWRAICYPGEWQGSTSQQGGAFILGPGQKCMMAHVDSSASDHCPINRILDHLHIENVSFEKDPAVKIV